MATFANQKVVVKREESPKDSEHLYVRRNIDDENRAIKELKEYELKLFLRLTQNKVGFEYAFSPTALVKELGGSDRSWRDAWKGLEQKGYISVEKSNEYEILEAPRKEDAATAPMPIAEARKPHDPWDF